MICAKCLRPVDAGVRRCPACASDPLVAGRYRLDRIVREDREGVSYRATQIEDGRLVRVRALQLRELGQPERGKQLASAAAQLCALEDPALPRAVDHPLQINGSEGRLWLIHEHRPGQTLAEIARSRAPERLEPVWVLGLIERVAEALARLHRRTPAVVHGALSPMTILITGPADEPKPATVSLLDLAILPTLTRSDPRGPGADIRSLGLVAVELLSRRGPEDRQGLSPAWRELVDVDQGFVELLERMLEPEPRVRIRASELCDRAASLARAALYPGSAMDEASKHRASRKPPSSPGPPAASPRFLMGEPMPNSEGSSSHRGKVATKKTTQANNQGEDIPVMRPEDLSRELSQAHRATSAIEARQRKQLSYARVLVVLISAAIAALITYIALAL